MARTPRVPAVSGWYHVMNRGVDRQTVFFNDAGRVEFGRRLGVGFEQFGVEIHAYCLMDNHFHLLVNAPAGPRSLSKFMHGVTSSYARVTNDTVGRDGPLFRGRFRSVPVEYDAQMLAVVRYIHRNPTDIRGVNDLATYRWSSHRTYLGHRRAPNWLHTDTALSYFQANRAAYERFVDGEDRPDHRVARQGTPSDLAAVVRLVADEMGLDDITSQMTRTVAFAIADRLLDRQKAELIDGLDLPTPAARRRAASRAAHHRANDERVDEIAARVHSLIA